jgi:hypothetical protein
MAERRVYRNVLRKVSSRFLILPTEVKQRFIISSTNNRNNREETDDKFAFPEGALFLNQDNVITVIHDNMGLNESHSGSDPKSPRGIRGFKLDTGLFGEWKVQGKVGGYHEFVSQAVVLDIHPNTSIVFRTEPVAFSTKAGFSESGLAGISLDSPSTIPGLSVTLRPASLSRLQA